MGAWGVGNFENDDALDFLGDLVDNGDDWKSITKLLASSIKAEYLEAPEGCEVLVAAELVAAGAGSPLPDMPEEASIWLKAQGPPPADLAGAAFRAITKVRGEDSELRELWEDAESEWTDVVEDLLSRLAKGGRA